MMFGPTVYDADKHTFIGGEIGAFIKRLGEDAERDLAVARYEEVPSFCIIEFLSPLHDVFIDIQNIGTSLANFTREKKDELLRRIYKPVTQDDISKFAIQAESDYLHERQDENDEEWEYQERLERGDW